MAIQLELFQKEHWNNEDIQNVELVLDFIQHLMNDHDFEYIQNTFGNSKYIQHNRSMKNGIEGVVEYVKTLTKRFPEFSYEIKMIHVDGAHVTVHSHATMKAADRGNEKKGFIIFDTWKIENGNLVEHWDALQPLDLSMRLFALFAGGSINNDNGLF